jgi:hypothetical protein
LAASGVQGPPNEQASIEKSPAKKKAAIVAAFSHRNFQPQKPNALLTDTPAAVLTPKPSRARFES